MNEGLKEKGCDMGDLVNEVALHEVEVGGQVYWHAELVRGGEVVWHSAYCLSRDEAEARAAEVALELEV